MSGEVDDDSDAELCDDDTLEATLKFMLANQSPPAVKDDPDVKAEQVADETAEFATKAEAEVEEAGEDATCAVKTDEDATNMDVDAAWVDEYAVIADEAQFRPETKAKEEVEPALEVKVEARNGVDSLGITAAPVPATRSDDDVEGAQPVRFWLRYLGNGRDATVHGPEQLEVKGATAFGLSADHLPEFRSTDDPSTQWIATLDFHPSCEGRWLHIRGHVKGAAVNGTQVADEWQPLYEDDVLSLSTEDACHKYVVSYSEARSPNLEGDVYEEDGDFEDCDGESEAFSDDGADKSVATSETHDCDFDDDDAEGRAVDSLNLRNWHWLAIASRGEKQPGGARQEADLVRTRVEEVLSLRERHDFCTHWRQASVFTDCSVLLGFRIGIFALRALRSPALVDLGLRVVSEGLPVGKEVAGSMQKGDGDLSSWQWTAFAGGSSEAEEPQLTALRARHALTSGNGISARKVRTHWRQACLFSDCPVLVSFRTRTDAAKALVFGKVPLHDLSQGALDELKQDLRTRGEKRDYDDEGSQPDKKRMRVDNEVRHCQPRDEPYACVDQEGILVAYKPAFWTVTTSGKADRGKGPGPKLQDWLSQAYGKKYPFLATNERAGCVHRLDIQTSGPILVGTTNESFLMLRQGLRKQLWHKEYIALMHGEMPVNRCCGIMDYKLTTVNEGRGWRTEVDEERGDYARTLYEASAAYQDPWAPGYEHRKYTLVRLQLITGRTHQIRVHLKELARQLGLKMQGLVGDYKYLPAFQLREDKRIVRRVFLHAHRLHFPKRGCERHSGILQCVCPLPKELERALKMLEKNTEMTAKYEAANRDHPSPLVPKEELLQPDDVG